MLFFEYKIKKVVHKSESYLLNPIRRSDTLLRQVSYETKNLKFIFLEYIWSLNFFMGLEFFLAYHAKDVNLHG